MEREEKSSTEEKEEIADRIKELDEIDRQLAELENSEYKPEDIDVDSVTFVTFVPIDKGEKKQLLPFPVQSLPEEIRGYVQAAAESLQVPVDMIATFVISALSMCVQGKYSVLVKQDWIEPINLYTLVIARPSERKSPSLKEVMSPIFKYVKEENERRQPEIAEYELKKKIMSGRMKTIQESLAKQGDKSKYKIQDAIDCQKELDDLEEVGPLRLILDDVTPEALVKIMKENGEKIAIVSAEGGIFGTMAGRYSDKTNIDIFLKGYSGEYYSTARIGRQGQDLDHPLITVILAVQPQVVLDIMDNKDFRGRGLLARFLYCMPPTLVGARKYRTKPINPFVKEHYENLVYELLDIPDMFNERLIRLSPEADIVSEQYNQWIEKRLTNEFEEFEDWAGKLHGNTMRIAGILHIIKHKLDSCNVPLEANTMIAAIEVGKYYLNHSKAAFDIMGLSDPPEVKDAKYILSRLETTDKRDKRDKNDKTISKRELLRLCRKFDTIEKMQPGLNVLVEHGYISIIEKRRRRGVRPSETVYINPAYINYMENQRNAHESINTTT